MEVNKREDYAGASSFDELGDFDLRPFEKSTHRKIKNDDEEFYRHLDEY